MARLNKERERKNMQKDLEVESPEKEPTEAEVKAFVERNLRKCDPQNPSFTIICVDGRYDEETNDKEDAIAAPGADLGLCMALQDIRLGFTPEEAFNLVNSFLIHNNDSFTWHSDEHVEKHSHGEDYVGCGHCNAAIKNAKQYGLQGERVHELLEIVRKNQARADDPEDTEIATMTYAELKGAHAERGILVINSDYYTVKHYEKLAGSETQYFGYDKQRYISFVERFVEYALKEKNEAIDESLLLDIIEAHTTATLGLLGSSKGKPVFEVTISEDGEVTVRRSGSAPDFTKK